MRVKLVETIGGQVLDLDVALVIVEDGVGNPISIACETNGGYTCETANNEERFNRILRGLGLNRSIVCDNITTKPLPYGAQPLQF